MLKDKPLCIDDLGWVLPLYKYVSVPIYSHPTPSEIMSIRQVLVTRCGGVKKAKAVLRSMYRCFLSENTIWRVRVHVVRVPGYVEPPAPVVPTLINVMVRAKAPVGEVVTALEGHGVPINPYSSPAGSAGGCVGFYVKSFEQLEEIADSLGRAGLITDAMIVNAVWYMKLGKFIDLRALVNTGAFVPTASKFKCVTGTVEDSKVTVFNTGAVRIMRAPRPDLAKTVAGKVYYLILANNAIIQS